MAPGDQVVVDRRLLRRLSRERAVLAFPGLAEDHRHPIGRAPRLDPPREPTRHPHQMGVVQLGVAAAVPPPPPGAQPARIPEREERVEHDPIHAVIAARQQIPVAKAELVGHRPNLRPHPRAHPRRAETARRATTSGRSPGRGVDSSQRRIRPDGQSHEEGDMSDGYKFLEGYPALLHGMFRAHMITFGSFDLWLQADVQSHWQRIFDKSRGKHAREWVSGGRMGRSDARAVPERFPELEGRKLHGMTTAGPGFLSW